VVLLVDQLTKTRLLQDLLIKDKVFKVLVEALLEPQIKAHLQDKTIILLSLTSNLRIQVPHNSMVQVATNKIPKR
jgi:hypothetical protein